MDTGPPGARVWTALLTVQVFFGTMSVAGKFAFDGLAPRTVAAMRVVTAAIVLTILARILVPKLHSAFSWRHLGMFALFSIFGLVINQTLFLEGLARTTAINATLLITTIPPFTLLIALVMGRETFNLQRLLGIVLSFSGVALLLGLDAIALGGQYITGNLLVMTNAFSFSLYLVLSRPYAQAYDPLAITAWVFTFGAVFLLVVAAPTVIATDFAAVAPTAWAALGWMILGPTLTTYLLNNWLLRRLDSSSVAAFIPLQPLVATTLAILLLDEILTVSTVVAGTIILVGVVISARSTHSKRAGKTI